MPTWYTPVFYLSELHETRELWYSLWVKFISSQSSNIIGLVLDSWSLGLLCKPKVLLPLAAVLFPWAMGDT